jgi:hypothetical protein
MKPALTLLPNNDYVNELITTKDLGLIEKYPSYGFTIYCYCNYPSVEFFLVGEVEAFYEGFRECNLVANVVPTFLDILPNEEFNLGGLTHRPTPIGKSKQKFKNTSESEFKIENFINFYTEI